MHQERDEGRDIVYPPDSRQELLVLWSLIEVFLTLSEKLLSSSTSDKLLSFNIPGTSGLERWSRWSGHISPADLTVFPQGRRKYKLRTPGFNSRFGREKYTRGYLSLDPYFPLLLPLHSNFFRCLPSNCHPAHSSLLCITITSVNIRGSLRLQGDKLPCFTSCAHCPSNKMRWSFSPQTTDVCCKWILRRW